MHISAEHEAPAGRARRRVRRQPPSAKPPDERTAFSIEGGTGRYAGARSPVTLSDDDSQGSLVTVRYRT